MSRPKNNHEGAVDAGSLASGDEGFHFRCWDRFRSYFSGQDGLFIVECLDVAWIITRWIIESACSDVTMRYVEGSRNKRLRPPWTIDPFCEKEFYNPDNLLESEVA